MICRKNIIFVIDGSIIGLSLVLIGRSRATRLEGADRWRGGVVKDCSDTGSIKSIAKLNTVGEVCSRRFTVEGAVYSGVAVDVICGICAVNEDRVTLGFAM